MPRRKKNPSYRLHKPRNLGFVELFVAEKGRTHRYYFPGHYGSAKSKALYHQVLAELQLLEYGEIPNCLKKPEEREGITVGRLVHLYIEKVAKVYYRTPTGELSGGFAQVDVTLRDWATTFGELKVETFTPRLLKDYREDLIQRELARTTIAYKVRIIVTACRWGVEEELVDESIWRSLQSVRPLRAGRSLAKETEPIAPVDWDDVKAVLPYLTSVLRTMVLVQWYTAARPGEICTVKMREIDREAETWLYRPEHHKTLHHGKSRVIPFGPKVRNLIRRFLRPNPDAYLFSPEESEKERRAAAHAKRKTPINWGNKPGTVKTSDRTRAPGEFFTTQSYGRAIKRACKKAKSEGWTPNQLRHSAATRIRREFGIEQARAVLGHSSAFTTEIYAEVDRTVDSQVMEKIG